MSEPISNFMDRSGSEDRPAHCFFCPKCKMRRPKWSYDISKRGDRSRACNARNQHTKTCTGVLPKASEAKARSTDPKTVDSKEESKGARQVPSTFDFKASKTQKDFLACEICHRVNPSWYFRSNDEADKKRAEHSRDAHHRYHRAKPGKVIADCQFKPAEATQLSPERMTNLVAAAKQSAAQSAVPVFQTVTSHQPLLSGQVQDTGKLQAAMLPKPLYYLHVTGLTQWTSVSMIRSALEPFLPITKVEILPRVNLHSTAHAYVETENLPTIDSLMASRIKIDGRRASFAQISYTEMQKMMRGPSIGRARSRSPASTEHQVISRSRSRSPARTLRAQDAKSSNATPVSAAIVVPTKTSVDLMDETMFSNGDNVSNAILFSKPCGLSTSLSRDLPITPPTIAATTAAKSVPLATTSPLSAAAPVIAPAAPLPISAVENPERKVIENWVNKVQESKKEKEQLLREQAAIKKETDDSRNLLAQLMEQTRAEITKMQQSRASFQAWLKAKTEAEQMQHEKNEAMQALEAEKQRAADTKVQMERATAELQKMRSEREQLETEMAACEMQS